MTPSHRPPRPIEQGDLVGSFSSRSPEQTRWLRENAKQAHAGGTAKVFVVTPVDSSQVVAYYAWSMAAVSIDDAPQGMKKGAGRYPQPVALLSRLGAERSHEGKGLGAGLLRDVLLRSVQLAEEIGMRGLLIHCETEAARNFYLHLLPELDESPTDRLHLVLLMKDVVKTLRGG